MSGPAEKDFPSDFPIKVMGRCASDVRAHATEIIERHMGALDEARVRTRTSSDGNFIAVTYCVYAHSRAQLDAVYRELSACKSVLMAL